jgi:hypothetical protein
MDQRSLFHLRDIGTLAAGYWFLLVAVVLLSSFDLRSVVITR